MLTIKLPNFILPQLVFNKTVYQVKGASVISRDVMHLQYQFRQNDVIIDVVKCRRDYFSPIP